MKIIISILATILSFYSINAQNINWQSIDKEQKDIAYLNLGYEFGMTTQIGYGRKIETFRPILLTADYSMPMGNDLVDDFKVRIGSQISIFEKNNFIASAKIYGIFRRHQTTLVRMASFGSEMAGIIGYYKPRWHIAGELGFDKSIVTHLKHSDIMRDNFPDITDGWFIPSGGHFYYGFQGSKTIGNNFDLSLRIGMTNAQFDDKNALLPYYAQFGLIYNISSKNE